MQYQRLGRSGLEVSRLCLGCLSFGTPSSTHPWTLSEDESRPVIQAALEAGINFFDTANVYSAGTSEEILGRALRDFARREEVVIATKLSGRVHPGPNGAGLSRKAILHQVDASLQRLGTDYIDLYQIHRLDPHTPLEETLEALHDVVKAGKVRYLGASSMYAWQFCELIYLTRLHGWTGFIAMQNHLNLLYREEEREMLGLCAAQGVGVLPWSPLARGRLARPWGQQGTERAHQDAYGRVLYQATEQADQAVVSALQQLAERRQVPMAQLALAWLLHKAEVVAPIVGVSRPGHLQDALGALEITLSDDERQQLEAPYVPHAVKGIIN